GWQNNAGYGPAQHRAALDEFGVTPHHRRSFKPIARILRSTS
ncbi:MAG: ribonuclease HII, partial [Rhodospirillaceae bacterium]|nr:ribonuclease HII [Rhodospirillaceae bacterium]